MPVGLGGDQERGNRMSTHRFSDDAARGGARLLAPSRGLRSLGPHKEGRPPWAGLILVQRGPLVPEVTLTPRATLPPRPAPRKYEPGELLLGAEPLKGNSEDPWWLPQALTTV